jgi:hypothetical protein
MSFFQLSKRLHFSEILVIRTSNLTRPTFGPRLTLLCNVLKC